MPAAPVAMHAGDLYEPAQQRLQDVVARTFGGWHVLGTRKVERLLPNDTMLTAVGEVNAVSDLQGTWGRMGAVQLPNSQVLVLKVCCAATLMWLIEGSCAAAVLSSSCVCRACTCCFCCLPALSFLQCA